MKQLTSVSGKEIKINWDTSKPNGDMRRRMSTEVQKEFGLLPKLGFKEGIKNTYSYYEKQDKILVTGNAGLSTHDC